MSSATFGPARHGNLLRFSLLSRWSLSCTHSNGLPPCTTLDLPPLTTPNIAPSVAGRLPPVTWR